MLTFFTFFAIITRFRLTVNYNSHYTVYQQMTQ